MGIKVDEGEIFTTFFEYLNRSDYTNIPNVISMTSVSFCEKCNSLRFSFDEKNK